MRKIVLYTLMSLDGAVDHPGRYFLSDDTFEGGAPGFDAVMQELEAKVIGDQDAVLLGRGMYDEWVKYWPTTTYPEEQTFARFINTVRKYVVTSTPLTTEWANAEAVSGTLAEIVSHLKSLPGRDIGVHGSIGLAQSLLRAGLVDELHLPMGPVVDPEGRRLFEGMDESRRFELLDATPTPLGAVWLHYRARW